MIPRSALPFPVFDELRRISVNLLQLTRVADQAGPVPPELARVSALTAHILGREIEQAPPRKARSRKDADTLLIATVRFRVTAAEYRDVHDKAAAAGLTPSEYARRQTLDGQVVMVAHDRVFDPAAMDELQAGGITINRHARIANQTGGLSDELPHDCILLEQIMVAHGLTDAPAAAAPRRPLLPSPGGP